MNGCVGAGLVALLFAHVAFGQTALEKAASRFVPGVKWKSKSVVVADFTCEGHKQQAILGVDAKGLTVIAIFLNGLNAKPDVLAYERNPATVRLEDHDLDYDPKEVGRDLPGFQRSKTCKGLTVVDDSIDPYYLYWDHDAHKFGSWSN